MEKALKFFLNKQKALVFHQSFMSTGISLSLNTLYQRMPYLVNKIMAINVTFGDNCYKKTIV